jgi:hypothetical protein
MSRRSVFLAVGILVLLVSAISSTVWLLLHYEPPHYRQAETTPGKHRLQLSGEFLNEFCEFLSALNNGDGWGRFSDEQINSYLAEGFVQSGMAEKLLPEGVSDPRITFEAQRLHLSFRYRGAVLNSIISLSLRIWLPHSEKNVVALQLEGFRAGLLPCTSQWLLERISETARHNGIDINWYRHEGYPVALLRFQSDQVRPTLHIKAVQLEPGKIFIHVQSKEPRAALDLPIVPSIKRVVPA